MSQRYLVRATISVLFVIGIVATAGSALAAPPRVTGVTPAPDALINAVPGAATANFDQPILGTDMGPNTFHVVGSGGDGTFNDGNEVVIPGAAAPVMTTPTSANFDLTGAVMPDDLYQILLSGGGPPGADMAMQFDGVNDFIIMPPLGGGSNPGPTAVKYLTMEAWVYLNSNDPLNPMVVMSHGDDYTLGVLNGHAWARIEAGCGNWVHAEGADLLPTNQWLHMAMVYDEIALQVYVNGQLVANTPHTIPLSYCVIEWPLSIGRQDSFDLPVGWYFDGVVDEARLWDIARGAAAIQADMFRTLAGSEAGLVGLWDFNGVIAQEVTDKSGTGNDGQMGASGSIDGADPTQVVSSAPTAALTNAAGEPLDGEFTGTLPSGDGTAGGNFTSSFRIDTTPPRVMSANMVNLTHVDVSFNEEVTLATAQNLANYSISPSLAVLAAAYTASTNTVALTTATMDESTTYTVTVSNVSDLAGNPVATGSNDSASWATPGVPPRVTGATMIDWTHVNVDFDEPVQAASAEVPANYSVTGGLTVVSATLAPGGATARLETVMMAEDAAYTVTVSGVRDLPGNLIVAGQGDSAGWLTGKLAGLVWLNRQEFVGRGVDQLRAPDTGWFTWKVKYYGGAPLHVRLHVLKSGVAIPGSPFDMNPGLGTPATGQNYWFRRQLHKGQYSYFFRANDGVSAADGEPTIEQPGPIVGNRPPRLDWAGTPGYVSDGLQPEGMQMPGTRYHFRVVYSDPEGDAAASVQCHIAKLIEDDGKAVVEEEVHGSPFDMATTDTDFAAGATFTLQRQLLEEGRYAVWFSAREDVAVGFPPEDAYGMPTWWHARRIWLHNTPPRLSWAAGEGFGDGATPDGIHPNAGPAGTIFSFRVAYEDPEATAPAYVRAHVLRAAGGVLTEVDGSPFTMTTTGSDFSGPVTYAASVFLGNAGNYRYYFATSDGDKEAVGEPSWHRMPGPTVTASGTAAVASLACVPAGEGAQLSFTLSRTSAVSAEVLNIAGRVVRTVAADRDLDTGVQSLTWDGRNTSGAKAPAGMYLVRVTARCEDGGCSQAIGTLHLQR